MALTPRERELRRDKNKRRLNNQERRRRNSEHRKMRKFQAGFCVSCNLQINESNHTEFHWDHIDPSTKQFDVSRMGLHSISAIDREIAKCQLLCFDCHVDRTNTEKHQLNRRENIVQIIDPNQLQLEL